MHDIYSSVLIAVFPQHRLRLQRFKNKTMIKPHALALSFLNPSYATAASGLISTPTTDEQGGGGSLRETPHRTPKSQKTSFKPTVQPILFHFFKAPLTIRRSTHDQAVQAAVVRLQAPLAPTVVPGRQLVPAVRTSHVDSGSHGAEEPWVFALRNVGKDAPAPGELSMTDPKPVRLRKKVWPIWRLQRESRRTVQWTCYSKFTRVHCANSW